jgi:DNA-binding transcriptional MocR family regulator
MAADMPPRALPSPTAPRYARIAARFTRAIEDGTYSAGDRLPSIRRLCLDEGVSVSTVTQALAELEARGLVVARPKSGYFVRPRVTLPAPEPLRPRGGATAVGVAELVAKVYRASGDPSLVGLGAAMPSAALLPARALARSVSAVARRSRSSGAEYEMPPGHLELRRIIAQRALADGCALSADDVVITSGATEAIHLSLLAVARPGDTVAVESPSYYGTLQTIEAMGLRALEVPCDPETGMDLDVLDRRLARQKVAAVVAVPSFNNPLGSCMPDAAKERLVRTLSARGIPLIEDDIYGDLAFGPARPRPAKAFDAEGGVLLCGSFSKSLAPGYRVGWVAPGRFRERLELLKFATNVATPTLTQRAIAHYLRTGGYDRHLRALRSALEEIVARVGAAVGEAFPPGTRVTRPRGGCFLWLELPPGVDALELHARALDAGVAIAPGPIFSPTQAHRNYVRLGCGEPWSERVAGAVRLVGRLAGRLAERGGTAAG